jgi:hypothetical protein
MVGLCVSVGVDAGGESLGEPVEAEPLQDDGHGGCFVCPFVQLFANPTRRVHQVDLVQLSPREYVTSLLKDLPSGEGDRTASETKRNSRWPCSVFNRIPRAFTVEHLQPLKAGLVLFVKL